MAGNVTVIERKSRQNAHGDARSASRRVSTLLACCLLVASLLALYEVAQLRQPSSNAANSSRSIHTIRRFYAGLNEYMETGEPAAVAQTLAPGALAFVPDQGAMGDDSELMTYLLALRSTEPRLRFTIDHIDAGDDIAIASVRMSDTNGARGASQEFFRVRDGRILQHWTTATRSTLVYPLMATPKQVDVTDSGHLAIAEITFSPRENETHPIDGHTLMVVQRGRVTLIGDGSSQILDIPTGAITVPGPNEHAFAGPGQAILITGVSGIGAERRLRHGGCAHRHPRGRPPAKSGGISSRSASAAACHQSHFDAAFVSHHDLRLRDHSPTRIRRSRDPQPGNGSSRSRGP